MNILAIDQGTTSTRALVFDARGKVLATAQRELAIATPHDGWVEQDAAAIAADTLALCREVIEKTGIDTIAAIGITNQRETTIVWDRATGRPIAPAIVWQDRRTADACVRLDAETVACKTGLLCDAYFSGTKIAWILDNVPGARQRAERGELAFGTVDSFLLWHLTEGRVHATDATNASRTMLYDIHAHAWDDGLCVMLDVPRAMLPELRESGGDFGVTNLFGKPLPIRAILGDQQAALFGQACFETGMCKSTYGTGCFMLMNIGDTPRRSQNRLLTTVAWRLDGKTTYAIEGAIFVAGAAVQFLRDSLHLITSARETEAMARSVPDCAGVIFVPALTGLGAPYWDPHARGALFGLTRGTTPAHIVRAALEAQAFQTRDLIGAMQADTGQALSCLRVDGGLARNDFVCQTIADQLECAVERPANVETTAWGAAALAGLTSGVFKDMETIAGLWRRDTRFVPEKSQNRDDGYAHWQAAIRRVMT
ncbi:MAG: glycerol kinase GlpK [Rhodospirillales bacterium]|nr:glycerol kinase GlpK [Alphaproteobacteria bacterium]MCB9986239.1 glycerol kinase GlpK [Rhodospirillales bacterium]USO07206.1 MAG: glycerol kinase GlpK [Rhodospirillales bacterium]